MHSPDCHADLTPWQQLLDGELDAGRERALIDHLDDCATCREWLEGLAADPDDWTRVRATLDEWPIEAGESLDLSEPIARWKTLSSAGDAPRAEERHDTLDSLLGWLAPTDDPRMLGRLGSYEIVGLIGRGGMGTVLKGFDRPLNRYVAIKVLTPELAASGAARQRFAREARAAAAVVHEHVVAIHAVAEFRGLPYLVMPYFSGQSLQQRLDRSGPLSVVEILRIARQAALGLAAAHDQGLVHRDVKPANILLESDVERVTLTDFGLARAVDDVGLTRTGVIAGTPQYMAPEQTRAEAVDHRADLFSLGSVMYAMCTGRPPFSGNATVSILRQISDEQPRSIREINPEIPTWLVQIVERLHEKNPADRFQSASEVAERLAAHLAHLQQPTVVPAPPPLAARGRPARSRRAAFGVLAVLFAAAAGLAVLATGLLDDADQDALSSRFDPRPVSYPAVAEFVHDLDFTPDGRFMAVAHGGQWTTGSVWLWDMAARKPLKSFPEPVGVSWIALSPDGSLVAYGTWEQLVRVRRVDTGAEVYVFATPGDGHPAVDFSPDGKWLAIATQQQPPAITLVDASTWQEQSTTFGGDPFPYVHVRFSRDGTMLAAGGGVFAPDPNTYGRAAVWDVATGERLTTVGHAHPVMGVDFAPDGEQFATACLDARARIWDIATGDKLHQFPDSQSGLHQVAFSPDGETLVSLGGGAGAVAWNISSGTNLGRMRVEREEVRALGFSPDGRFIATGGADCLVRLWDPATREEAAALNPAQDDPAVFEPILAMACSPDESLVALGRQSGTILVRELATGAVVRILSGHADGVSSLAFAPDGATLASGSYDGTIRLWDVTTWETRDALSGHEGWVLSIAISPDGRMLASGGDDFTVRLWNLTTLEETARWDDHTAPVRAVAFAPDGRRLVSAGSDGTAVVWNVETSEQLITFRGHTGVIRSATFSPDGQTVATAAEDGRIMLWNARTGRNVRTLAHGETANRGAWSVAFAPDGQRLASGGQDAVVRIWDVALLKQIQELRQHTDLVTAAAFLPKSGALLTAGLDETIKVWKPREATQ